MLRNVRLIEELRASRRRLVAAQDDERRRLERNIHDGAQQQLVALQRQAAARRGLIERDPAKARELLSQLQARHDRGARGPARPRARDLPAAARRPGARGRARGAGAQVAGPGRGRGRRGRPVPAGGRGGRLLLRARGAATTSRSTRRPPEPTVVARAERRDAHVRGLGRRRRVRRRSRDATAPACRGWPTALDAIGGTLEIRAAPGEGTTVARPGTRRVSRRRRRCYAAGPLAAAQADSSRSGPNTAFGM